MSALSQLVILYEQWGELSNREHDALDRENWKQVAACQSSKDLLKQEISACSDHCSAEERKSPQIREILRQLISVQQQNKELLEKIRDTAEQQRYVLGGVARKLRRIHHSYGQPPSAVWQSYS